MRRGVVAGRVPNSVCPTASCSSHPFPRLFYCYVLLLGPREGGFSRETRLFVLGWGGVGTDTYTKTG